MFETKSDALTILVVDHDQVSFQMTNCIASALKESRAVELIHAEDSSEALALLEKSRADVILFRSESREEADLLFESLPFGHPPIVLQSEQQQSLPASEGRETFRYIPENDSVEGVEETIKLLIQIGEKYADGQLECLPH